MSTRISTHSLSPEAVRIIKSVLNLVMLALSVMLIAYISYNTFNDIPFLTNRRYMNFQFWVCMVFIFDFFMELWLADNKWRFVKRRFLFLLLSVPWLNIVMHYHVALSPEMMYFARFIPLARGALAVAIVVSYVSSNKVTSVFVTYTVILVAFVYFGSLIFLEEEHGVNPSVPDYGAALWWAALDTTTLGSSIYPVTAAGKIVGGVLSSLGMIMFPLFTVFITNLVTTHIHKQKTGEAS
ncbi:MAG: two pore domain potassium channel family protein [Barnesiella sp.]|nr:two pore domain potassium channel family protein [Barnesiella sp.]